MQMLIQYLDGKIRLVTVITFPVCSQCSQPECWSLHPCLPQLPSVGHYLITQ